MSHLRIAFFVSGSGTLFESLTTGCRAAAIDATPALVICSNPKAMALDRARRLDVPSVVIRRRQFDSEDAFGDSLLELLRKEQVNFVCLAGYLEYVPAKVVREFRHRMLNIHPALLPSFGGHGMYGRRVHEAVLRAGVRVSGATVHIVDEEYDHGPIVLQRPVFVRPNDTVEALEQRVHQIEFDLYADAVKLFTQERIRVEEQRAIILPPKTS